MNKYLLLRDNKQSGPYTVPEIIDMGIKAYDLVWLEGKSAAWRYPSEIEELKAYAPAVEEQPFDRFYKKPDSKPVSNSDTVATPTIVTAVEHERYQPKIDPDTKQDRKVYINFPASASKPVKKQPEVVKSTSEGNSAGAPPPEEQPVVTEVTSPVMRSKTPAFPERKSSLPIMDEEFSGYSSTSGATPKQSSDRRVLYASLAACLLLGLILFVLYFNYSKQKESLKELSSIVHELETREKEEQQGVSAALAQDAPASAMPQNNTAGILPEQVLPSENMADYNVSTAKNTVAKKPATTSSEAAITFKESKPASGIVDEGPAESEEPGISSTANLFKLVEVKPNDYKTGVLGGISNLQFEITNNSTVELHRVAVEIKYLGPEKKVVKKQTVYFENISPGAQTTIDVPKSNRGVTIEYTITDIKS